MICLIHSILSSSETHCTQEESYCCVSSFVNICFTLILCILDFCQYPTYGHNLVLCFNWYTSSFRVYRLQFLYMENMYRFLRGNTIFHFSHLKYFSCTIHFLVKHRFNVIVWYFTTVYDTLHFRDLEMNCQWPRWLDMTARLISLLIWLWNLSRYFIITFDHWRFWTCSSSLGDCTFRTTLNKCLLLMNLPLGNFKC